MLKSTAQHTKFWQERKIDWKTAYLDTIGHPHRKLIMDQLRRWHFGSILEIGCASGPNLYRIAKEFGVQVGGVDVNPEAIAMARRALPGGILEVGLATDLFFSDKSADVILSDMTLIYVGPGQIGKAIEEIKRVARSYVVLCEFHHSNLLARLGLSLTSGYYAYNYPKLLARHGFYDIEIHKISQEDWPGGEPQRTFGYIITAKV